MCRNKHAINRVLLHAAVFGAAALTSTIFGGQAFATPVPSTGLYVDQATDIRWEYELITDTDSQVDPQKLTIRFYDKPVDETTVTVPSLSDLISNISGATNDLNTYYLRDADVAAQDSAYGASSPRRVAEAPTTVLDMTNTGKIQILGVQPIIDPDIETELIFGSNMVLGDEITVDVQAIVCSSMYRDGRYYTCDWSATPLYLTGVESQIPGWDSMTASEKMEYHVTAETLGYASAPGGSVPTSEYDRTKTYVRGEDDRFSISGIPGTLYGFRATKQYSGRAFSGYKLKLTNFTASNFNYVGWETFKDSEFSEDSTTIVVDGNSLNGGDIFKNTNIKRITINTDNYGVGLFRDCQNIENVTFGENATYLQDDTFAGTNLTGISFEGTNVKRIGARAFEGAQLTQVDFGNMERIDYHAFRGNDIKELYLPKSINYLQSGLFAQNQNLKKATIAYDTLSSGTTLPFWVVVGGGDTTSGNDGYNYDYPLEEVNIIAPYSANEPVSATHVTYDDYRWGFNPQTQAHTGGYQPNKWGMASYGYYGHYGNGTGEYHEENTYQFETDYADYDNYKNILAPLYFASFKNLKKVTIGEGYEYIGSSAFWYKSHLGIESSWPRDQKANGLCDGEKEVYLDDRWQWIEYTDEKCSDGRYLQTIQLPETLKGVGNLAFQGSYAINMEVNLPQSLEFIGVGAFQDLYHMTGDVDLPNLKYLGDFAFEGTSLRDVAIRESTVYWGNKAFSNIPALRNITIDLDLFDPDLIIPWTWRKEDRMSGDPCQGLQYFRMQFGTDDGAGWDATEDEVARWGFSEDVSLAGKWSKFGKITFTEKVVHEMPMMDHGSDDSSSNDVFFGQTIADEIDMGAVTAWKTIPRKFFTRTRIGKITLPPNLEVIAHEAFNNMRLEQELVLPDSIKVIGMRAFESYNLISSQSSTTRPDYSARDYVDTPHQTPIIKKLPASLEYVGYEAFWGDLNMTADLNAPNLKYIGSRAFMNSGVRDVLIPNGLTDLREAAFAMAPNLRNITIDVNINDIYTTSSERLGLESYAFPAYFVEWAGSDYEAHVEVDAKYLSSSCSYFDEQWAAGYFEEHPDDLKYYSDYCKEGKPFETFYTVFSKHGDFKRRTEGFWQNEIQGVRVQEEQLTAGDTYGTITFGPHATQDIESKIGAFSGLTVDKVDLGQTGWTKLTTNTDALYQSKIGTVVLPSTIETVNYASFMKAEVTNPIILPASLRTIDTSAFQWAKIGGLDIKEGLTEFGSNSFLWAEIGGEFSLPNSLRTIKNNAFMEAKGFITNMLPEGVEFVGGAAFYQTDMADELTIPSAVTSIQWSAFNANNVDVHYDKVTIKPDLTPDMNSNQLVHQMLWHVDMDELVVESNTLVGIENFADRAENQEFYNLPMDKVVIKNLPMITYGAFDKCSNLVEVDMSQNANLRDIKTEAFLDAEKLHIIKFSPALKNETVNVGQRAFVNTAFETMGDSTKEFDLTAAKFNATTQGLAFAWMPKLRTLDIPRNFSNNTIPVATFYNDTNLEEVTVDYKITLIDNGAFVNDTKIKKVFIWGNTVVKNDGLEGYTAPEWFGQGGDDDDDMDADPVDPVDPATLTIPGQADIYAYSVSPTEAYADFTRSKPEVTGTFYPLDEVLYLTSNKPTVLLNDDETDFDKSDLIVYGLRRDGLVLESDNWAEYDGVVFARSAKPLTFEKMAATVATDPAFGTVYDTPVPISELNFGNENFAAIDFAIVPATDDPTIRIVNIVYTDGYTGGEPDTDIDPREIHDDPVIPDDPIEPDNPVTPVEPTEPEKPETPETPKAPTTNDSLGEYLAIFGGSIAAGFGLIGWKLITSRKRR